MEIERLISALEETISLLRKSRSSDWSNMSVEEIIGKLESQVAKAKDVQPVDLELLDLLFTPTGVIQETSIDNNWGAKFVSLADVVDQYTVGNNL